MGIGEAQKCVGMTSLKGGEGHIRRVPSAIIHGSYHVCTRYFNQSTEICLSHPGRETHIIIFHVLTTAMLVVRYGDALQFFLHHLYVGL